MKLKLLKWLKRILKDKTMAGNELLLVALATITTLLWTMYHQIEMYFDSKEFIKEKKEEKKKMTEKEILVRNIENYRISHKLTKLELSKKLGLGTSRITNLENVESDTPSWKLLERLSKLMNKSFSELFTLDKEQFGIKEEPEDNQFYSKLLEAKNNEIEGLRKQLDQKTDDVALKVVVNRTSQECTLYKGDKKSDAQVIRLIPERGSVHIDVPINSVEWVD